MKVEGIHHVLMAMPEGGEEQAIEFYDGLLGIPTIPKPPHLAPRGGCWFESEEIRIHMGVEPGFKASTKAHVALVVTDLVALRTRLEEAGVETADDQPLPGFDRFYSYDPFWNRLEFVSPQSRTA